VAGGDALMRANEIRIAGLAIKSGLPSMYGLREFVEAGGLMSYGADTADSYRRVAYYVDRILKEPSLPICRCSRQMKFEFIINLKAAKQIGLTIPPRVLERANQVIK
jgi:putative tryptophan/tyrosine transport system substrate-binding protein